MGVKKAIWRKKALCSGLDLSSHPVARALLSALRCFKTLFEKGRVGSTSLKRPERNAFKKNYITPSFFELVKRRLLGISFEMPANHVQSTLSTVRLKLLPAVHRLPINLVVSQGSIGKFYLGVGFPLRCFQRLSNSNVATLRCA